MHDYTDYEEHLATEVWREERAVEIRAFPLLALWRDDEAPDFALMLVAEMDRVAMDDRSSRLARAFDVLHLLEAAHERAVAARLDDDLYSDSYNQYVENWISNYRAGMALPDNKD